jgi:hypothetical protein
VHGAITGSLRKAADTLRGATGQGISIRHLMDTVTAEATDIRAALPR